MSLSRAAVTGNAKEKAMTSILSTIGRIATEFNAARTRYQTERAILSLPREWQKDLGWPEAADTPAARHCTAC